MKNLFNRVLVLAGLLLLTAATVKASEPVKPDTATKSTGARIIPVSGGAWNYTTGELCASAHAAIPTATFTGASFNTPATGIYWLVMDGTITATGKHTFVYFPLIKNGSWYEIDPTAVPPGWTGGGAGPASCSGLCYIETTDPDGDIEEIYTDGVCSNVSQTWMVNCQCSDLSNGCQFNQYPVYVTQTMYNALKQIHD